MIDIRRKRQTFHQNIRMSQRDAYKKLIRNNIALQKQHQDFINVLNQPFSFCQNWEHEKHLFWTNGPSLRQNYYTSPSHFISQTSHSLKEVILQFEHDPDAKLDISYFLIENLPFLIPPPHMDLDELPKPFVQLCMFILKNPHHDNADREGFVDAFASETISRCLLNYFAQNWTEIKDNKCNDIFMNFFTEFNKHKNVFSSVTYNDKNFQFLLEESIKEILNLTQTQRDAYNKLNSSFCQLSSVQNQRFQDSFVLSFTEKQYPEQVKIQQVMKYTIFLSNLLLLSPKSNFNIKKLRDQLKMIASYLYRKVMLNQCDAKFHISAEFCVSILVASSQTCMDQEIQIMTTILNSQVKRIYRKQDEQKQANEDVDIDTKIPTKQENLNSEDLIEIDEGTYVFLNRMSLLMISSLAQNSTKIKFRHVQKWLYYQMRRRDRKIFKLQNPEIIKCLLSLLGNLINNEKMSPETFKSYSYQRQHKNLRAEQIFGIKASICKLIDKNGFKQLFGNQHLKEYRRQLCDLLCLLMDGLDQLGDVSAMIWRLFNFENNSPCNQILVDTLLESDDECSEETEQMDDEDQNQGNNVLSAIKIFIYKVSVDFLEKTYKQLEFKKKEKLLLYLVKSQSLSGEECGKYLTLEQRQKFKKNIDCSWELQDSCSDSLSDDQEDQDFNSESEERCKNLLTEAKQGNESYSQTEI